MRFLLILAGLIFYTCFKATQLWPANPVGATAGALLFFAVMIGGILVHRPHQRIYNELWFLAWIWAGSLSMAVWATFVIVSLPLDGVHLLIWLLGYSETLQPWLPQFHWAVLAIACLLAAVGFLQVLRGPQIVHTTIPIEDLTSDLDGFKIAQISDLHVGPTVRHGYVEEVVRRTNSTDPDLVLFTGDIADAHAASVAQNLKPFTDLKSRYGIFYVTGNHEYYWDTKAILREFQNFGLTPLLNENVIKTVGTSTILIGGVTDPQGQTMLEGHTPDLARAAQTREQVALKILLAHRPGVADEAESVGFDLQFSGHTHAGQFFPFSLFIGLAHQYSRGLYRHGDLWVYVNPGTAYWGPADRLAVTPEISLITLQVKKPIRARP